ncbi:hypothetical protein M422DRAFT_776029 [Sphaerobolus stellatus SS14]|nr:hypothetical protein M422DRAFT_776029 [Sphaerobolus stellatus SS14]
MMFRGVRLGLAALLALFSIIVLGISADFIRKADNVNAPVPSWLGYTLAVSIITWLILIPIFIIDLLGIGLALIFVIAELVWTFILMVLWVAAAGSITNVLPPSGCIGCSELQALDAFAWLSWITILAWFIMLLVLSIISHSRGHRGVWRQPVSDTQFGRGGATHTMSEPFRA